MTEMMWTHWNELVFNNPELGGIRSGWGRCQTTVSKKDKAWNNRNRHLKDVKL